MGKNLKSFLSNLSLLSYLGFFVFTPLALAQMDGLSNLFVVSHIIRVNQGLREEKTFYYGISEEMEIENRGVGAYQGSLAFWVGEGEDLRVVAIQDGNDTNLEVSTKEGIVYAKPKEEIFIKPGQKLRVNLDYKVFFTDEKKREEFTKKILYPHGRESLQFKVNPVENIGFRPQLLGFSFRKSEEESGWFVSPKLSPKVGEVYFLTIAKEGEIPGLPEEKERKETPSFEEQPEEEVSQKQEEERGPIIVAEQIRKIPEGLSLFHAQVKRWIWENILPVFVLNDVLVLSLVGYKRGWFKKLPRFPGFPRIAQVKRRKGGKKRKK